MVVLNSLSAGTRHAPRTTNVACALNGDRLVPPSFVAAIAALCVAASPLQTGGLVAPALAATGGVPTPQELGKLSEGLAQVDYLLDHWVEETSICKGPDTEVSDLQLKQVMRTEGNQGCKADPLVVQQYLGFRSMKSPLFNAAKLMLRAEPLVADSKYDAYTAAVDEWTTKAQMSSTMAYTSSWGEANPNGGQENVEALLESTKIDVKQSRALLKRVIDILEVPPAPPFTPPSKS